TEVRGYALKNIPVNAGDEAVEKIDESLRVDGELIIYECNPIRQFTGFTAKAHQLKEEAGLYLSPSQIETVGFAEGTWVRVKTATGEHSLRIIEDNKIDGSVMCVTSFDPNIKTDGLFEAYRFASATIHKEG
ncbi:MAG: ferredoxin, partial [Campylobacterales bacterium]